MNVDKLKKISKKPSEKELAMARFRDEHREKLLKLKINKLKEARSKRIKNS